MLNSCDFQGRLAADPELRTTQTGKQVASFRMAVDRDMVDANGHRPTDWLTFTAWGKTAEFVSKYFRKGSAAVVHSRCQTRQYEDKNGNNRTAIEFVVDNIYFAGPKQDNQQGTVDDGGTNPPPGHLSESAAAAPADGLCHPEPAPTVAGGGRSPRQCSGQPELFSGQRR